MTRYRIISSEPAASSLQRRFAFAPLGQAKGYMLADTEVNDASDLTVLRQSLRGHFRPGSDLGLMPEAFKAQAVFLDMDGTTTTEESLVEMARLCGKHKEVEEITVKAMAGEIEFDAALRKRLELVSGLRRSDISQLAHTLTLSPGIEAFSNACRQWRIPLFLVSGGFTILAEPLSVRLGFQAFLANELEFTGDRLTGHIIGAVVNAARKASWLREVCIVRGYDPKMVVAVGDGANDLPMLKEAGLAVGYLPKTVLLPHLDVCLGRGDHRALLHFLRDSGA